MNDLKIFSHRTFGEVRTVMKEGEPWFVAADVCSIFGVTNSRNVTSRLDDDEKGVTIVDTLGGKQNVTVVNEAGLYHMLFSMEPNNARGISAEEIAKRIEQLKAFKRWITHEVIPSIRKHGAYMTPDTIEQVLSDPDALIRLATELKQARETNQKLKAQNSALTVSNQILQPKADYFDELVDRNLLTNFRVTAKELQVGEREFIKFLLSRKYIFRDQKGNILPHSAHAKEGLFEVKETYNQKTEWRGTQTLITPKGRETFRLLMIGGAA